MIEHDPADWPDDEEEPVDVTPAELADETRWSPTLSGPPVLILN